MSDLHKQIIDYCQTLTVSEGRRRGEHFTVLPWQSKFIKGFTEKSTSVLTVARGNGKTTLIAAIACAALDPEGPLHIDRGEVVIVAASLKQASIAFRHILFFLDIRKVRKDKERVWRIQDNSHVKEIEYVPTGTVLKCIGSDPGKAHGLAPSLVICDEPAKWEDNQGSRMYAALKTARGKQVGSKLVALGTLPENPDNWFLQLIRENKPEHNVHAYFCEADENAFSVNAIRKANPSLAHMPDLEQEILEERDEARNGGEAENIYKALRLNMGTPEVRAREMIVSLNNWRACLTDSPKPREGPLFVGIDLGGGTSMTAIAFYWAETGRLEVRCALPAEPSLEARGRADKVADRYVRMRKRSELKIYPGFSTNNARFIEDTLAEIDKSTIHVISGDSFKKTDLRQGLAQAGINYDTVFRRVGTGEEGSQDIRSFQAEVLEGHLNMAPNLAMDSSITESCIRRDPNGNPALDKARQRGRIDCLQASVIAVGNGRRWRLPEKYRPFDPSDHIMVAA